MALLSDAVSVVRCILWIKGLGVGKAKVRLSKDVANVSNLRNQLRRKTYRQSIYAIDAGCYLEAIAISESLICDSLESFLQKHRGLTYVIQIRQALNMVKRACYKDIDLKLMLRIEVTAREGVELLRLAKKFSKRKYSPPLP